MKLTKWSTILPILVFMLLIGTANPVVALGQEPVVSLVAGPSITSPRQGATVTGVLSIKWRKVTDAVGYQIQISDNVDFTAITNWNDVTGTSTIDLGVFPGVHYVRLRATFVPDSSYSDWGPAIRFTYTTLPAPTLLNPADGGSIYRTYSLKWQPVTNANIYIVQIDDEPNFEAPIIYDSYSLTPTSTVNIPGYNTYYWRIKVADRYGIASNWSVVRSFSTIPPAVPHLVSPANNANAVGYTQVKWSAAAGAMGYYIEFSPNADLSNSIVLSTNDLFFTPDPSGSNTLYWRVRSSGVNIEDLSNWSETRKINYVAPDAMVLNTPGNGKPVYNPFTLAWSPIKGSIYQIYYEFSMLPDFTGDFYGNNRVLGTNGSVGTNTPISILQPGIWYLRAKVEDTNHNLSPLSNVVRVEIIPPATPSLISPKNGISVTSILLKWKAAKGASDYYIRVDNDADMSSPIINVLSNAATQWADPQDELSDMHGPLYWCVVAVDGGGNYGSVSPVWSFVLP